MKVCSNCKTVNNDESKFCVSCGAEIVGSAGMASEFSNSQGFNSQNTMNQGQQFNQSMNQGQQFNQPMNQGQQYNAPNNGMYQGNNQPSNTDSNQMLLQWAPVAAAVLGVIIGWAVSMLFGLIISIGAFVMSFMMRQRVSKPMISIVVSGIATAICFLWFILYA